MKVLLLLFFLSLSLGMTRWDVSWFAEDFFLFPPVAFFSWFLLWPSLSRAPGSLVLRLPHTCGRGMNRRGVWTISRQTNWRHRPNSRHAWSTTQNKLLGQTTPAARSTAKRQGGKCGLGTARGSIPGHSARMHLLSQVALLGMRGEEEG